MCLKTLATIFLVVLNIGFFLGGGAMLAVGIIAFIDEDLLYKITDLLTDTLSQVLDQLKVITNIDLAALIKSNAIVLLCVGGFLFVLGFLGVCGACKKNATLLKIYGTIVTGFLMAEIGVSVYAYMYADKFEKNIQDGLKLALYKTYKEGLRERSVAGILEASKEVQELGMDSLQLDLQCCGISNGSEWRDDGTVWNRTYEISFNKSKTFIIDAYYPPSCCVLNNTDSKKDGFQTIPVSHFSDLHGCMTAGRTVQEMPCFDRVKKIIKNNEDLIIIIFVVTMAIQLIAVIFACFLKPDK